MSESSKLEDEKKVIRSILIPLKSGCSLAEFQREYRSMIGQNVPSADYGFGRDVVSFLASMPDVVRLRRSGPSDVYLTVVADASTRHIQKMVEKQKPQKRKSAPPKRVHYPHRLQAQPQWTYQPQPRAWVPAPAPNLPPRLREKKLPYALRARAVEMVRTSRGPFSLTEFLRSFEKRYGEKFTFQSFGFFTLEECLEKIPELAIWTEANEIYVRYVGPRMQDKVPPQSGVLEAQKGIVKTNPPTVVKTPECKPKQMDRMFPVNRPPGQKSPNPITPAAKQMSYVILNEDKRMSQQPLCDKPNTFFSKAVDEAQRHERKEVGKSPHELPAFAEPKNVIQPPVENNVIDAEVLRSSASNSPQSREPEDIPPFVLKNLEKIAAMYPRGIWATDFPDLYEDVIQTEFDLHSLGYNDLSLFIDAVPAIFKREVVKDVKNNWLICPTTTQQQGSNPTNPSVLVVDSIICNIRRILEAYPEGIKVEEFLHIYSINCSDPLNIKTFGFNNVEGFLTTVARRVPLKITQSLDGKLVHLVLPPVERAFHLAPPSLEIVPFDAVLPPTRIEMARLPENEDPSKYIPVYTSTIESPSLLYIQVMGPEYSGAMHQLYDKMEEFYHSPEGDLYKMRNAHIRVGTVCVALWPSDQHWYRVRVISIPSLESVQVFYIDYGTKEEISTATLRYMRKEYAGMPAQALVASLACLKPAHQASRWDPRARSRMLRLCKDTPLMASVSSVLEGGVLSLILCNTNVTPEVYINDVLLNERLADIDEAPPMQEDLQALQAQMLMQAACAAMVRPDDVTRMFQGLSMNASRPQQQLWSSAAIPPPVFASDPYSTEPKTPSPTESEVFGEEDDKFFDQFYSKVVTVMKRYVKRVRTSDSYTFHVLILDSLPYVSCGDISSLIWSGQDSDYLVQRLQNREVKLPSRTVMETECNKDLFHQIQRFFVKGCQKVGNTSQIFVYSLDSVIEILNLFGQPSADLRKQIHNELASFNPSDPHWQELSEAEFPELEEPSVATDDDKLNRLCLYDLLAMKESIRIRRLEKMRSLMSSNGKVDEVGKMEHLLDRVVERIQQIKEICTNFK